MAAKSKAGLEPVSHPFAPVWDDESRVLILGTMPSPQSRREGFYYGHPQNRFWKVLAAVLGDAEPFGRDEREAFLRNHHIALWDVLASCLVEAASDSSIRQPQANDLNQILLHAPIRAVFANGQTAARLYQKLAQTSTGRPCRTLLSTSPANARSTLPALRASWQAVREALDHTDRRR